MEESQIKKLSDEEVQTQEFQTEEKNQKCNEFEIFTDEKTGNVSANTTTMGSDVNLSSEKPKEESESIPKKKHIAIKILIGVALVLILAASYLAYFVNSRKDLVAYNTSVKFRDMPTIELSGLSYTQAVNKVDAVIENYLDSSIQLSSNIKSTSIKLKDAGVTIDTSKVKDEIKKCIYGPYIYDSILKHLNKPIVQIPDSVNIEVDDSKINNFIISSLSSIESNSQDADLFVNKSGELEIKREILGHTLDKHKLIDNIISAVKEYKLSAQIPVLDIIPPVTESILKEMMPVKIMSTFSSYYGGSDSGRKENVRLGALLINNALLKPGEEFEFWKYVGDSTPERGFKPAAEFRNGKVVMGIGGGLCQVSTTLYNSALLADLEITERSPHGLPVYYVPLGLDATVSIGWYSLRFKNNTDKYILIKSKTDGSTISFDIYGYMPEGKSVKAYSKIIGNKVADAYRTVYMNDVQVRQDYLGRNYYK